MTPIVTEVYIESQHMNCSFNFISSNNKFELARRIPTITSASYIIIVCLTIATVYNIPLWRKLLVQFNGINLDTISFSVALLLLHVGILSIPFFICNFRHLLKLIVVLFIVISGTTAYYNNIGIAIDKNMLINIMLTDSREASEVISGKYVIYMIVYVVLPAMLLLSNNLVYPKSMKSRISQCLIPVGMIAAGSGLAYSNYQYISYFGRQHQDLTAYLNPSYTLLSAYKVFQETTKVEPPFVKLGTDAVQIKKSNIRRIGIFIVGETARADHFSLNGYAKNTNPELSGQSNLYNFSEVTSCGTSTAYSIPCMFSFLNGDRYTPETAKNQSNVLDVLSYAGVTTLWQDNNSSCKGVCARSRYYSFRDNLNIHSQYYNHGEYADEVLLSNLDEVIESSSGDLLIVLHQLGSHGPAYYKRYPIEYAKFKPECNSPSPQTCTQAEVNNSYDNTILYTDYLISRAIDYLASKATQIQSFVFYASDHGESLGESGIYLHGLPKQFAPPEQRHIPMLLWLSRNNDLNTAFVQNSLANCEKRSLTHDVISHTLLSLFDVESTVRNDSLSLTDESCSNQLVVEP